MVWIDTADEECFKSVLSVLHRGNFDVVLDAIGKTFDLDRAYGEQHRSDLLVAF